MWAPDDAALGRAMRVNGCTTGTTYETAEYEPFAIGTDSNSCKRVKACSAAFPLVICPLPFSGPTSNETLVAPGWPTFLELFEAAP